jgi:hypothetical protein
VSGFENGGNGNGNEGKGRSNPHARKGRGYKGNIGNKKQTGGGGDIEDRQLSPAEYSQLSDGQKTKLKALQIARGGSENKKDTWQAAQLLMQISKLEAIIAQTNTEPDKIKKMIRMLATPIGTTRP